MVLVESSILRQYKGGELYLLPPSTVRTVLVNSESFLMEKLPQGIYFYHSPPAGFHNMLALLVLHSFRYVYGVIIVNLEILVVVQLDFCDKDDIYLISFQ